MQLFLCGEMQMQHVTKRTQRHRRKHGNKRQIVECHSLYIVLLCFFSCVVFLSALETKVHLNLGGDLGLGVGDLDAQLLGAGNDVDALAGRDGRGNLGGVGAVVHHQELEVLDVVDQEGLVAGGHHVAGLLVGAVADLGCVRGC